MKRTSDVASDSIPISSIQWGSSWPKFAEDDDGQALFSYLEERFGIPAKLFDGFLLFKKNKSWWLLKETNALAAACRLKISSLGMRAFNQVGDFIKPTTRLIQIYGTSATKAGIELREEELRRLLEGEGIPVDPGLVNGYVILRHKGHPVGLGLLINGTVRSQLPSKELKFLTA